MKGFLFTLVITALGFPFVLPPITLVYYWSKLTWKPMSFPLNSVTNKLPVRACSESGNQSVPLNTNPSQSDRPRKRKGGGEDEGPKYPKRGRPASYHPDKPVLDTFTFPQTVLTLSLNGQWTVSQKGRPYYNIAIDEAHECLINLRLKTITARPSHFHTVELANFMSYLDSVLDPFENLISRPRKLS